VFDDPLFAFFAQLNLPGVLTAPISIVDGPDYFCLIEPASESWARVGDGTVTQGGSLQLWDTLERAHKDWIALDRPAPDQFHITITADGQQCVGLDGDDRCWSLPL
jgi:hypothetical protein